MRIIGSKFLFFTQNECLYDVEHKDHRNINFYIIGYQKSMECIIFCIEKGKKTKVSTRDSWNRIQINRPYYCDEKNYFLHTDYITNDKLIEEVKKKYYGQNFL